MKEPRNIQDVIDAVRKQVPKQDWGLLEAGLTTLERDICYTAPEDMGRRWFQFSLLLAEHLGDTDTDWKKEISRIMRNEE